MIFAYKLFYINCKFVILSSKRQIRYLNFFTLKEKMNKEKILNLVNGYEIF